MSKQVLQSAVSPFSTSVRTFGGGYLQLFGMNNLAEQTFQIDFSFWKRFIIFKRSFELEFDFFETESQQVDCSDRFLSN